MLGKLKGQMDTEGREFNWFAFDVTGEIVMFATAGSGFIPECVCADIAKHDAISDSIPIPHVGSLGIWDDYASVGLWVFDWGYMGAPGPYKFVRAPSRHAQHDLTSVILAMPTLPRFTFRFAETREITVEMIRNAQPANPPYPVSAADTRPVI